MPGEEMTRMDLNFLGGFFPTPAAESDDAAWRGRHKTGELRLYAHGSGDQVYSWDTLCLLVRGYLRLAGSAGALEPARIAEELRWRYLESGTLDMTGLEGNFTLVLLDAQAQRLFLYRNLAGTSLTYYHVGPCGLLFGSNLADLVERSGVTPQPNHFALPSFFLHRRVPGRETLFAGFQRLLPGELAVWDGRGLSLVQRHSFADYPAARQPAYRHASFAATFQAVLLDCAAHRPGAVNLLSGDAGSCYLQAYWNEIGHPQELLPATFSLCLDHPAVWAETDRAVEASATLGTQHTLVPVEPTCVADLLAAVATTGEPPIDLESAALVSLAHYLDTSGLKAGIWSAGWDCVASRANAGWRSGRLLRAGIGIVCRWLGWPASRPSHADPEAAVVACFGPDAVADTREALMPSAGHLDDVLQSVGQAVALFHSAGKHLLCPLFDSRLLHLGDEFQVPDPQRLLPPKVWRPLPRRQAEPLFDFLAPGGHLRSLVDGLGSYAFVDDRTLEREKSRPGWFLYSLVCYDLWHRLFIEGSLPRRQFADTPGQFNGTYRTDRNYGTVIPGS
jgi:hypothetical protein